MIHKYIENVSGKITILQNEENSMFLGLSQLNNGTQFLSLVAIIDSYHNFEPQNPLNCA